MEERGVGSSGPVATAFGFLDQDREGGECDLEDCVEHDDWDLKS